VKEKVRARNIRVVREMREWITEYKRTRGCLHCGMTNPICLQFHHYTGGKEVDIASAIGRWSKSRIITEIEKCIILCANCHLIEHARLRATGGIGDTPVLETGAVMA
jgi:hypothetical protein